MLRSTVFSSAKGESLEGSICRHFPPVLRLPNLYEKRSALRQLGWMVQKLQQCQLPQSFHSYYGAGFDEEGNIISKAVVGFGFGGLFKTMTL